MEHEYLPATQIISKLEVPISASTLRNWGDQGKIRSKRPGGKRFYNFSDVKREIGDTPIISHRGNGKIVGYARVSSSHQKADLDRQEEYLRTHCELTEVIRDIGSGLNYNRKGFSSLLSQVENGCVTTIVVTYKDRLCRFGFELVERICRAHDTKLMVLCGQGDCTSSEEVELANDLLDVCNYFVAKRNGRKAAKFKQERAKDTESQIILEPSDEEKASEMVPSDSVGI